MGKRTVIGIGIFIALLGAIGTFNAARSLGSAPVEKRDVTTEGVITHLETTEFKNQRGWITSTQHTVSFSFEAEDGQSYTGQEQISSPQYRSLSKGQPIDVIYKSDNPKNNAAVGHGTYISVEDMPEFAPQQRLWICLGLLVFGAVVLGTVPFLTEDAPIGSKTAHLEATYGVTKQTAFDTSQGGDAFCVGLSSATYLESAELSDTPVGSDADELPEFNLRQMEDIHPTAYVHQSCGDVTEMPSDIRAIYLLDPCYYSSGAICASCGEVPDEQCTWVETGENLADYMKRLRKRKSSKYHMARFLLPLGGGVLLTMLYVVGAMEDGKPVDIGQAIAGIIAGSLLAYYPSNFVRLAMCKFGWI